MESSRLIHGVDSKRTAKEEPPLISYRIKEMSQRLVSVPREEYWDRDQRRKGILVCRRVDGKNI